MVVEIIECYIKIGVTQSEVRPRLRDATIFYFSSRPLRYERLKDEQRCSFLSLLFDVIAYGHSGLFALSIFMQYDRVAASFRYRVTRNEILFYGHR